MAETLEPDSVLIRRSVSDPDAFDTVFERHFDAVWAFLRQRVGRWKADDLTSATFINGFAARESFRSDGSARPWLLRIASNLASNQRRDEARQLRAYARNGVPSDDDLDEDGLLSRIHASRQAQPIAEAIAALSDEDRELLLLSALAELPNGELADAFNLTPNAVGVRLHRIRAAVRPILVDSLPAEPRCAKT